MLRTRGSPVERTAAAGLPEVSCRDRGQDTKPGEPMTQPNRSRRSVLAVPGSSPRFLDKAQGLAADEVFLDLEDAVAPDAKAAARRNVVAALTTGDWGSKVRAVRVNGATSQWAYRDVIEVVEQAGSHLDVIVLPKVSSAAHLNWLDLLLGQIEQQAGWPAGQIGIEAQIEDARGLAEVDTIAAASSRLEALVFGPADFMASIGMRSLQIGAQPAGYAGDAFSYPKMRLLVAARSHGLQAVDGPHAAIGDLDGLRRSAADAAALGYDGKWVLHPGQIDAVNAGFSPRQEDYDRAELILEAYDYYTRVESRGAAMLDGEMIDEASRKLALVGAARGRAAGLARTVRFERPAR
jgi:citrate lyase subunit beta/citryl-CoA lyase